MSALAALKIELDREDSTSIIRRSGRKRHREQGSNVGIEKSNVNKVYRQKRHATSWRGTPLPYEVAARWQRIVPCGDCGDLSVIERFGTSR
jgi:hypothetical protein